MLNNDFLKSRFGVLCSGMQLRLLAFVRSRPGALAEWVSGSSKVLILKVRESSLMADCSLIVLQGLQINYGCPAVFPFEKMH